MTLIMAIHLCEQKQKRLHNRSKAKKSHLSTQALFSKAVNTKGLRFVPSQLSWLWHIDISAFIGSIKIKSIA